MLSGARVTEAPGGALYTRGILKHAKLALCLLALELVLQYLLLHVIVALLEGAATQILLAVHASQTDAEKDDAASDQKARNRFPPARSSGSEVGLRGGCDGSYLCSGQQRSWPVQVQVVCWSSDMPTSTARTKLLCL